MKISPEAQHEWAVKVFMCIEDWKLRRAVVELVEEVAGTG
jgi:hypothetical protein